MSDTDWIVEGAKVIQVTDRSGTESCKVTTIERLTDTQIICADGERFNRVRLRKSGEGYNSSTRLVAYDSPEGQRAVNRMRRRNALAKVQKFAVAVTKARLDQSGDEVLLAALDDLGAAVAAARTVVADTATQIATADQPEEPAMHDHIVTIEGPDSAGHYEFTCTCGEDATGYEAEEILAEAETHGVLAAWQQPVLNRVAADIAANAF